MRGAEAGVVVLARRSTVVSTACARTFAEILAIAREATVLAVDIPIGLPAAGRRAADLEARAAVGPRRNSVFLTPPRAALEAPDIAAARGIHPSLTSQAWALRTKIFEVEALLDERIFEVHPEVSFAALAGRHLAYPKRSWNGQMERRRLLANAGLAFPMSFRAQSVSSRSTTFWTPESRRGAPAHRGRHPLQPPGEPSDPEPAPGRHLALKSVDFSTLPRVRELLLAWYAEHGATAARGGRRATRTRSSSARSCSSRRRSTASSRATSAGSSAGRPSRRSPPRRRPR